MKAYISKINLAENKVPLFKAIIYSFLIIILSFLCTTFISSIEIRYSIVHFNTAPITVIGVLLLCTGFMLRILGTFLFYRQKIEVVRLDPQNVLIQSGIYAFTRNPLYIGLIVIAFGSALVFGSVITLALTILFAASWHIYVIRLEEPRLKKLFGRAYAEYAAKVPRWF